MNSESKYPIHTGLKATLHKFVVDNSQNVDMSFKTENKKLRTSHRLLKSEKNYLQKAK